MTFARTLASGKVAIVGNNGKVLRIVPSTNNGHKEATMVHVTNEQLFDAFSTGTPVRFSKIPGQPTIVVDMIEREDGSGVSFNVTGVDIHTLRRTTIFYNTRNNQQALVRSVPNNPIKDNTVSV